MLNDGRIFLVYILFVQPCIYDAYPNTDVPLVFYLVLKSLRNGGNKVVPLRLNTVPLNTDWTVNYPVEVTSHFCGMTSKNFACWVLLYSAV